MLGRSRSGVTPLGQNSLQLLSGDGGGCMDWTVRSSISAYTHPLLRPTIGNLANSPTHRFPSLSLKWASRSLRHRNGAALTRGAGTVSYAAVPGTQRWPGRKAAESAEAVDAGNTPLDGPSQPRG
ncbi:hypothetical protein MRX96_044248 [Rhipicephalus microplus]